MSKIYQFYQGWELVNMPTDNAWEDFQNHEALRVAAITGATWEMNGWTVKRLTVDPERKGFKFTGALATMIDPKMPQAYWDVWHELWARIIIAEVPGIWVSEIDVANFGYTPAMAEADAHIASFAKSPLPGMVQTLEGYWDTGCMYVTAAACEQAISIIERFDSGELQLPKCGKRILGFDALLRQYCNHWSYLQGIFDPPYGCYNANVGTYAYINNTWRGRKLLHFPRSSLRYYLEMVDK